MGLRLIASPQSTNVVPLRPVSNSDGTIDERLPDPRPVCGLAALALLLDQLPARTRCESCRKGF